MPASLIMSRALPCFHCRCHVSPTKMTPKPMYQMLEKMWLKSVTARTGAEHRKL